MTETFTIGHEELAATAERMEQIKKAAVLAFAPPALVIILGAAFAWAVNGFRP